MAATDQTHRNQRMLDLVFGVSCLFMLVSLIWMFYDDQYRDWKKEQRQFRNVAEAMAQRAVVNLAPSRADMLQIDDAQEAVVWAHEIVDRKKALVHGQTGRIREIKSKFQDYLQTLENADKKAQAEKNEEVRKAAVERLQPKIAFAKQQIEESDADLKAAESQKPVDALLADAAKAETGYQNLKAELDSQTSFYNDAIDKRNRAVSDPDHYLGLQLNVSAIKKKVDALSTDLAKAQDRVDEIKFSLSKAMEPVTKAEADLSKKEDNLKALTADFDRFHKLAEQKKWGAGDWFRSLPVLDAFASPIKIQQYTLDELTIDYSFKRVTRYDRCTTCHLGIDQPTYTKEALLALTKEPSPQLNRKLSDARRALRQREKITGNSSFDPDSVQLARVDLTPDQINEFCAHPRLDLFVGANSPHPAEKVGCTICHAGQGSATSFLKATHTPNNAEQQKEWAEKKDWEHDHNWDYPMLPNRFIESSCVKCHYQITDLIREGSKEEAPKLIRGFNLVRENGCFGCHEIAGIKGGRSVGPDLRLEPTPPLDDYTPAEKAKLTADTLNPPGAMRKVGPSLRRLSEKTSAEWLRRWIKEPRNFRPDTKMPHFYGLANNRPDMLPSDQANFPDQEINAIAHFLLTESELYLKGGDTFRKTLEAELKELSDRPANLRSEKENLRIQEITRRLELQKKPEPLSSTTADGKTALHLVTADGKVITELPKEAPDLNNGRKLFTERGCLACHMHEATTKSEGAKGKPGYQPALENDAHFGPNLTRLAAKLGNGKKDSARTWLVQWILNPKQYHPRTYMPQVHLDLAGGNDLKSANDIAGWLLAQKADWPNPPPVAAPDLEVLKKLAAVFLNRSYSPSQVKDLLGKENGFSSERMKDMAIDRDERELATPLDNNKLMRYIGRKAINQYGCFGCHDIPGFEYAKPIGTPLNDWGKKDAERLAFEDAAAYVRKYHHIAPLRDNPSKPQEIDAEWKAVTIKEKVKVDGKEEEKPRTLLPYEKYFYEALDHHQRDGFLHQKLMEPRSYDYARLHVWDDRLRMPQFNFSRKVPGPNATAEDKAKIAREEAEAREAVMTFILGLVAEPVPPKYIASPPPERLAEAQGRKVLDKFNCAGCHLVRPGVYEFKTAGIIGKLTQTLEDYKASPGGVTNHVFPDHNAWVGPAPTRPDRLTLFGVNERPTKNEDNGADEIAFRLTHAVRFPMKKDNKLEMADLPAGSTPPGWALPASALVESSPQFGGTFGNLLTGYLVQIDRTTYPPDSEDTPLESQKARPKVPPALLREGEKTQPLWLYQFLREPTPIRPQVVLRMPKFNMSEEDALALVNYFSAADKLANPGMGLHYPYFSVKERADAYLDDATARYLKRLETDKALDGRLKNLLPVWGVQVKDRINELQAREKAAEDTIKALKESAEKEKDPALKAGFIEQGKAIERDLATIKEELKTMGEEAKDDKFPQLSSQWKQSGAYMNDAFRLATSKDTCVKCHLVGGILMGEAQGPPLHLAEQRLRPEWVQRWVALPERFTSYPSPMPPYFARLKPKEMLKKGEAPDLPKYQEFFVGDPDDQVKAMRDFLMNYRKAVDMPVNRNRPVVATGGK